MERKVVVNRYLHIVIASTLAVAALSGCDKIESFFKKQPPSPPPVAVPTQQDGRIAMLLPDFTELVTREGPAVVNIQASRTDHAAAQPEFPFQIPEDDPLYDFFRRFLPPPQEAQPSESVSFGSGFIISPDGYVMTNAHVVQGSSQIKVVLTDKRELKARLIGSDKRTDVALLKVDATNLPVVNIGDPNHLKVGEWVAAIGAPFGFENSVTAGIVSAKGRSLPTENYVPFIQTDVAINPGNSGGPLFNLKGQVIGINSQIYSRSGGFMGISFAIPIDIAMGVAEQIKAHGKVTRGQLGINIQDITPALAQSFGLKKNNGALIVRVDPAGPAAKAGLQSGDIILKLNDRPIESSKELPVLVGSMKPGTLIKLVVWHKGAEKIMYVTLAELSQETPTQGQTGPLPGQGYQLGKLGLTVTELTPSQRSQLGLRGGLLVQKVQGPAARAGLQHGDVIIGFNQIEITSAKQLDKALSTAQGNIALLVRRMDSTLFVPLTIK